MGTTKEVKSATIAANVAYALVPLWFVPLNLETISLNISSWTIFCIFICRD